MRFGISFLLIVLAHSYGYSSAMTQPFEKKQIQVKNKKIWVEMAVSEQQRAQGLMYRKSLGKDEGMLFVFPQEKVLSFWMKNTFIPLTIAYFNKDGILIDLKDMEAFGKKQGDPPTYPSSRPAKYALEMNQGWFSKNQVGLGSKLRLD